MTTTDATESLPETIEAPTEPEAGVAPLASEHDVPEAMTTQDSVEVAASDATTSLATESPAIEPKEPGRVARLFANRAAVVGTLTTLTSVALVVTVLTTLAIGYPKLKSRASQVQLSPVSVVFDWPPLAGLKTSRPAKPSDPPQTWVNAELRSELAKLALTILADDPLDVMTLERARTALVSTGWFQNDLRLIRDEHNSVHVLATWRVPVAAVRVDSMDQLVSAKGELLSPRYAASTSGMKTIVGVKSKPPELGQPWLGGEVVAALKLIEELASRPGFSQVASIDASDFLSGRNLVIVTDRGNRVFWGGAPDQFTPGQPSTPIKLARLDNVFRRYGRIDAGRALLDVRVIDGVYVHDTEGVMSAASAEPVLPGNDHR